MICYHGTTREHVAAILRDGFWADSWFARTADQARVFGGPVVLSVEFPDDVWSVVALTSDGEEPWQFHCPASVSARQIRGIEGAGGDER